MDNKNIKFEAQGGQPNRNSWNYELILQPNSKFILNFSLKSLKVENNTSVESVEDSVFNGDFTVSSENVNCALSFSNIYKSAKSQDKGDLSSTISLAPQPYPKKMSALITLDGFCDFKKDNWGVYMKTNCNLKEFFKTCYQVELFDIPNYLNGNFSGNTTTQADKDYDDWYCCYDKFELDSDGNYTHLHSYANHDYVSRWTQKKSGKYIIRGNNIILDTETLKLFFENKKLSYAKWNEHKLNWEPKMI